MVRGHACIFMESLSNSRQGFRWAMKIRNSWWRIRRAPSFVSHPLSRSHDLCMTGLCIRAPCTLPFVLAPPVGSKTGQQRNTETPLTGEVCSPIRKHSPARPLLQLSENNFSPLLQTLRHQDASPTDSFQCDGKLRMRLYAYSRSTSKQTMTKTRVMSSKDGNVQIGSCRIVYNTADEGVLRTPPKQKYLD